MRKLNEVRDFNIVKTEEKRLYVEFTLPGESEILQFKWNKAKMKFGEYYGCGCNDLAKTLEVDSKGFYYV